MSNFHIKIEGGTITYSARDGVRVVAERGQKGKSVVSVYWGDAVIARDEFELGKMNRRNAFFTALPVEVQERLGDAAALLAIDDAARTQRREFIEHPNAPSEHKAGPGLPTILNDRTLLDQIRSALRAAGWVGDIRPALLCYFAMTSRVLVGGPLGHPINLAFVAPPAAGKNAAVEKAMALMPVGAVYLVRAASERALIYLNRDLAHKVVVFGEADSIPDEGAAASAIRSLASDNELRYEVVEKNDEGRHETREIVKPGPTVLITTSTKRVQEQLGTRVLEVPLPDDPAQTRLVMQQQAAMLAKADPAPPRFEPLIELQEYLAASAPHRVAVPYAPVLADTVPATAARTRRDFPKLLSCIQVSAVLHQRHRQRDADGCIVATIEDYENAYDLMGFLFDIVAADGVTKTVRSTVEAVAADEQVTQTALAARLQLSKSSVSARVKAALAGGYLLNVERREGYPHRLMKGAPLPDALDALPSPQLVRELFETRSSAAISSASTASEQPFGSSSNSDKPTDSDRE